MSSSPALAHIANELTRTTGFLIDAAAQTRLERFIEARCKELNLRSQADYLDFLNRTGEAERSRLVSSLTITYSWFNRDAEQLELALRLLRDGSGTRGPAQVWVAGCASGEEAYSLLLLANETPPLRILATDINDSALERARHGLYEPNSLKELPAELRSKLELGAHGHFQVPAHLRGQIRFERHNVLEVPPECPSPLGWDLIMCRNVLLYFEPSVALAAMRGMGRALSPHGLLLLGANDFIYEAPDGLECVSIAGRVLLRKANASPTSTQTPSLPARMAKLPVSVPPPPSPSQALFPAQAPSPRAPAAAPVPSALGPAIELLDKSEFHDAERALARLVEDDPLNPEARLLLGIAAYSAHSIDDAIGHLRAALFLNETLWPAAYYLGMAYENAGQVDEASRAYRWVVEHRSLVFQSAHGSRLLDELCSMQREIVSLAERRAARLGGRGARR